MHFFCGLYEELCCHDMTGSEVLPHCQAQTPASGSQSNMVERAHHHHLAFVRLCPCACPDCLVNHNVRAAAHHCHACDAHHELVCLPGQHAE